MTRSEYRKLGTNVAMLISVIVTAIAWVCDLAESEWVRFGIPFVYFFLLSLLGLYIANIALKKTPPTKDDAQ